MNIFKKLLGAAALALIGLAGFGTASPAHAAITCAAYGTGRNSYPQDGTHAFRCTNTATNTKPSDSRSTTLFDTVSDTRFPASAKNRLKNANVLYFFFNNQAEADTYFSNTSPYNQQWPMASVIRGFNGAALNTQCANTGMISYLGTLYIAVAVYDTCVYQTNGVATLNPDLPHIVLHESGHAYDFTFASGMAAGETASKKTFWRQSVQGDWGALTPSNWNSLTAAQKNARVCNIFNSANKPSNLEFALGASHNGGSGTAHDGRVCQQTSPAIPYPYYASMTPANIATDKMSYFYNAQELFAETFALEVSTTNWAAAVQASLLFSDWAIKLNNSTPQTFYCTREYMKKMVATGALPTAVSGCPAP